MRAALISVLGLALLPQARGFHAGLNFPPQKGTSQNACYLKGVYNYNYSVAELAETRAAGFNSLRLPVNVETSMDAQSLAKLSLYVDAIGGKAIIVMFGAETADAPHGTGRVDDVAATTRAWASVHSVFKAYPDVRYELFNEPYGYGDNLTGVGEFIAVMRQIMRDAELPEEKCIAGVPPLLPIVNTRPKDFVAAGWQGDLAYHVYPIWLPVGAQRQEDYYNMVIEDIGGISSRVWLSEFGAALDRNNPDYAHYDPSGEAADVNSLRGLHMALLDLAAAGAPVKGAFHWHGWRNGDDYDFFLATNANGRHKVKAILADLLGHSVGNSVAQQRLEPATHSQPLVLIIFALSAVALVAVALSTVLVGMKRSRKPEPEDYIAIKSSA